MKRWIVAALVAASTVAAAEELAVGNYGVSANGMPFGVAMAKGYFKEEGINVTGLITSAGGGTSLRNMLAGGGVPYGEVNPGVVVSAILAGADLKIISDNVLTVAEFVEGPWMAARVSTFPLVDRAGRPTGIVTTRAVAGNDRTSWATTSLASLAIPIGEFTVADPGDLLIDVLRERGDPRARVLVTHDARLIGIVSPTDVAWALERHNAL